MKTTRKKPSDSEFRELVSWREVVAGKSLKNLGVRALPIFTDPPNWLFLHRDAWCARKFDAREALFGVCAACGFCRAGIGGDACHFDGLRAWCREYL